MPTTNEMRALGRNDLIAALAKHKGVKKVAALLGWSRSNRKTVAKPPASSASPPGAATGAAAAGGKSGTAAGAASRWAESSSLLASSATIPALSGSLLSHASSSLASPTPAASRIRRAVLRRPKHYWDDVEKVMSSISAFVAEYGVPGVMPTGREFANAGQGALRQAAQRHGGLVAVAAAMGLKSRKAPASRNTWSDKAYFSAALLAFADARDPGVMPTASELKAAGESQLANAVTTHGGYPAVARALGLLVRNARKEGAPELWDRERLADQLRTFTATFYPSLAVYNRMPSESQLRRCGRNDLCYAISKWGGYKRVQEELAFAPRLVGPRPFMAQRAPASVASAPRR